MALILSIETSERFCSAAVSRNYDLIGTLEIKDEKSHASLLTVLIQKLFAEKEINLKEIDAVAISKGPGSYTGLRIGVSVSKGICYALNVPLISINTLQVLCHALLKNEKSKFIKSSESNFILCPMIDARRMEVYMAFFDKKGEQKNDITATLVQENSFSDLLKLNNIVFFGSGAEKCKNIIQHKNAFYFDNIWPNAIDMISLAYDSYLLKSFENTAYFEPFYLKDFVATIPKKKIEVI